MCGICGIVITSRNTEGRLPSADGGYLSAPEVLRLMNDAIKHRGPDNLDQVSIKDRDREIGLGHSRLSIIDLSPAGNQPMQDTVTANWITYNGEVYNYEEIRSQLNEDPSSWKSDSDSETVLRAYARWGKDCLTRLRGMFAFAIWDATQHELFIARDRLGIKPVYYYSGDGFLIFASEIRALLASQLVARKIDPVGFYEYLTYQSVPAPRTLIKGIRALPPGAW